MFSWAIAFFVIALIAAVFGFFGLAASAAGIAKIIFVVSGRSTFIVTIPCGSRRRVDADTFYKFAQPTVSNTSQSEKLWLASLEYPQCK